MLRRARCDADCRGKSYRNHDRIRLVCVYARPYETRLSQGVNSLMKQSADLSLKAGDWLPLTNALL